MLMPTLGDARLACEQRAEILKSDPVRVESGQGKRNDNRHDFLPPTHRRICFTLAQRNTTTPCHRPPPGGDNATVFYEPINLAKALIAPGGSADYVNAWSMPPRPLL